MTKSVNVDFHCPHCQAGYRLVRVANEGGKNYATIRCKVCRGPLAATEGDDILKYFLVRRPETERT